MTEQVLLTHLMIGPLIFLLALLTRFFPHIADHLFKPIRKSHDALKIWHEANRYSSKAMLLVSIITIFFQVIAIIIMEENTSVIASTIFMITTLLIVLPLTENHLKNKFWYHKHKN